MTRLPPQNLFRPGTVTRLKRRSEFLRTARQGKKWVTDGMVIQARQRNRRDEPCEDGIDAVRVGFTVTKKVGNAVIRNRVRRRLKAAAAEVLPTHAGPGQDIVIIGRMATIKRRYSALVRDMETSIRKLGQDVKPGKRKAGKPGAGRERDGGLAE